MKSVVKCMLLFIALTGFSRVGFGQTYTTFGDPNVDEGGNVLLEHPTNPTYLVAGTSNDRAAIFEVDANGLNINSWVFDVIPGADDYITEMKVDNEGNLLGVGVSDGVRFNGFAFRFDLITNTLLWVHRTNMGNNEDARYWDVHDLPNTNEVLVIFSLRDRDQVNQTQSKAAMVLLDRSNGTEVAGSLRVYSNGGTNRHDGWYSSEMVGGHLHVVGRARRGGPGRSRPTIVEVDITGTYGNVVDANFFIESGTATGETRARDFVFLNADLDILAAVDGPINGTTGQIDEFILLRKNFGVTTNGFTRYSASGASQLQIQSIQNVPGGVLLYLRDQGNSNLILVRFNVVGTTYSVVWSKRYVGMTNIFNVVVGRRSSMLIDGNRVRLVNQVTPSGSGGDNVLFADIDLATGEITGHDLCVEDVAISVEQNGNYIEAFNYTNLTFPHPEISPLLTVVTETYANDNPCEPIPVEGCDYTIVPNFQRITDCEVQFTANVSGTTGPVVQYRWDFGDGVTSNEQNPLHQYFAAGVYSPTLTVSSYWFNGTTYECCEEEVQVGPITVTQPCDPCPPNGNFTAKETCCGTFEFEATGVYHNTVVFWEFDDGTFGTGANITHSYTANSTYNVKMIYMYYEDDVCCIREITQSVVVNCTGFPAAKMAPGNGNNGIQEGAWELENQEHPAQNGGILQLLPNPAQQLVNVQSETGTIETIRVFDMAGRPVLTRSFNSAMTVELNIAELGAGVYYVMAETSTGTATGKLVKE